jgi:Recombination endonuclease VII
MTRKWWTDEENAYLREVAPVTPLREMAEHLDRTVKAVRWQCAKLGLEPMDGRQAKIEIREGQEFGRLVVQSLGQYQGKRSAWVRCTGPHDKPVEKWVQVHALTSGAVRSCGCLNSEVAAERARKRNISEAPPRLGTGKKGLPPGVKYVPVEPKWRVDDDGRQCTYSAEGNCGNAYKPWAEFNKGTGAREHASWCKSCQSVYAGQQPPRRDYALAYRCQAFGITVEQYRAMEALHDGRCWLCGQFEVITTKDGERRRLVIDHDHNCCDFDPTPQHPLCGKCIRGLCCQRCNRQLLGHVDAVGVQKVVTYLASAQAAAQALLTAPVG